jgi:large subunit ribosomal protein L10
MKQERVDKLRGELEGVPGLVIAGFSGLSVGESQQIRSDLREAGGQLRIVKNTLARLSLQGTDKEVASDMLTGANLIAFGEEPVGPAKAIVKAAENGKKITIKGGVLNGKFLSGDEIVALSKLPSLGEMQAKFLGVLNQVPQQFVSQLAAVPRGLVTVLSARRDELEEAS